MERDSLTGVLFIFLVILAASPIVHASEIDCEIVPFEGHTPRYFQVDNPAYKDYHPDHLSEWKLIQRPLGGFIGDVIVKGEKAVGATARLRIYEVRIEDLLPPAEDPVTPRWFQSMGKYHPEARERDLLYEHTWKIDSVPYEIPVILQRNNESLNRCVFEILDETGNVIYSTVPGEVYYNSRRDHYGRYHHGRYVNAWVFSDEEVAHHRLSSVAKINNVLNMTELPGGWDRFLETRAVWIDGATDVSADTLRRIILSGGWIFGTKEGLESYYDAIGLPATPVLSGGIKHLDEVQGEQPSFSYAGLQRGHRFQFKDHAPLWTTHAAETPMEDREPLFSEIRSPYLIFTVIVAGVYVLAAVVLLPLLFIRLRGGRRLALWWKTPLVIVVYTLLVVGIGWVFIQPRGPLADVTEYRLGYGDWPEVFCNINTVVLKFGGDETGWGYPEPAHPTYIEGDTERFAQHTDNTVTGRLNYMEGTRGMETHTGFAAIKEMRQPFDVEIRADNLFVSSERSLRNVHIALSGAQWLDLGDIEAGEEIEVCPQEPGRRIRFPTAISRNALEAAQHSIDIGRVEEEPEECDRCGEVHQRRDQSVSVLNGSVFLIGVDEEASPDIEGLHRHQKSRGRVAWISQVPIEGFERKSPEK